MSKKTGKLKYKINGAFLMVALLVGVVLVNLILGAVNTKVPLEIDLTKEKVYEFSDQTKEIMNALDKDITIYAIYAEGAVPTQVEKYLNRYQASNNHITIKNIDPYTDPVSIKKFETNGDTIKNGDLIVECGDKFKIISSDQMTMTDPLKQQNLVLEQRVTNAVYFVTGSGQQQKIYFTEGHGEFENSALVTALKGEDYDVATTNLSVNAVPEDADAIVILGAQKDFSEEERDRLAAYLENGGNGAFIFMPGVEKLPRLEGYLAEWGITAMDNFVVENNQSKNMMTRAGASPIPDMQQHAITENLIAQKATYVAFPTMSFSVNTSNPQQTQLTPLLKTSADSFGKSNIQSQNTAFEEGDVYGPLNLAVMAEKFKEDGSSAKVFAAGSILAFEYPQILTEAAYANGDFALNTFSYMTEKPSGLSIRPKVISPETMKMTQTQVIWIVVLVVLVPIALLVMGIVIWFRRRYL